MMYLLHRIGMIVVKSFLGTSDIGRLTFIFHTVERRHEILVLFILTQVVILVL